MRYPKAILFLVTILILCHPARGQDLRIDACEGGSAIQSMDNGIIRVQARNQSGFRGWGEGTSYFTLPGYPEHPVPIESHLWVSGLVQDSLRVSGNTWAFQDYWPGVIPEDGSPRRFCSDQFHEWNDIWMMSKAEAEPGVFDSPTQRVRNWPAGLGAPYVSTRADGTYDPDKGDRPSILGDRMQWWPLTDLGRERGHDGYPVGLAVEVSPFLFDRSDITGQSVFVRYQIRNVNAVPVTDAYVGLWKDGMMEINGANEGMGSDSLLALAYHFFRDNSWSSPQGEPDTSAYPAFGVTSLRARKSDGQDIPLHAIMALHGDDFGIGARPEAEAIRNLLKGRFIDGNPVLKGGGVMGMGYPGHSSTPYEPAPGERTTRFMFSGDPVSGGFWTVFNTDGTGTPYDGRAHHVMLSHGPFDIEPGEEIEFVIAYVFGITDDHLTSVTRLKQNTAALHQNVDVLLEPSSSVEPPFDPEQTGLRISEGYPNPATESVVFRHDIEGSLRIRIVDVQGRVRLSQRWTTEPWGRISLDISTLPSGIYAVRINTPRTSGSRMIVVQR